MPTLDDRNKAFQRKLNAFGHGWKSFGPDKKQVYMFSPFENEGTFVVNYKCLNCGEKHTILFVKGVETPAHLPEFQPCGNCQTKGRLKKQL